LSAIRSFLSENDINLPESFWRRLRRRRPSAKPVTRDVAPTKEELKKIIIRMPLPFKCLSLLLASSGMRIGEAVQIRTSDVNLDSDPVEIYLRPEYTKTGEGRYVFISSEAKEMLLEYLKERKPKDRIFPFGKENFRRAWNLATRKAGLSEKDERTQRYLLHPHSLRKFFRTQLATVIPLDVVECLMGHSGYLTQSYRRYRKEELAEFYKKGEYALTIFTNAEEIGKLRQQFEEQKEKTNKLLEG